ncbi:MAG: STAS domain-containing protein [Spirochaetia bacterium]|jgi:anti-sigma B factor antagonist|nr:STAS domain-containing protein [Spirochaetia bacterium]
MEIKLKKYSSTYIIEVAGDMDLYSSFELKDVVTKMLAKDIKNYVIDLAKVDYIDSSGIGVLIHIYSNIKKLNRILKISNVHGSVEKVIKLTKLSQYFPIVGSVKDALLLIEQAKKGQ